MTKLAQQTYNLQRTVPKGRVTTYKDLADALGTKAYRAIGQFMRSNPYAPEVPCHRVVTIDGRIGGFRGGTGVTVDDKIAMLKKEGVHTVNGRILNFDKVRMRFKKRIDKSRQNDL